jgi:hypothetical protein
VLNLIDQAAKSDEEANCDEEAKKEATQVWWCPNCGASPSYYCVTECDGQRWIPKLMIDGKTKEESNQRPKRPKGGSKRKLAEARV